MYDIAVDEFHNFMKLRDNTTIILLICSMFLSSFSKSKLNIFEMRNKCPWHAYKISQIIMEHMYNSVNCFTFTPVKSIKNLLTSMFVKNFV